MGRRERFIPLTDAELRQLQEANLALCANMSETTLKFLFKLEGLEAYGTTPVRCELTKLRLEFVADEVSSI